MFAPIYFLLIVWLQITYASKYKLRRVDPGYNSKLQLFCANPQFLNHSSTAQKKIMHGTPVPKGKYPWAIVMKAVISGQTASYCGGTIISSRHILTARHCFEKHPESLTFFVGGVCYEKGENCDEVDMRPVEIEFAAFEPRDPLEANNRTIKLRNHEHDFALVQLKEDLKHFGGDKMFRDTRPACLPQLKEPLAKKMHVYGWGTTEKQMFGSRRLMEVALPVMDTENDPLAQSEGFLKEKLDLTCTSKSLYCIHSAEEGNQKDGASGDSGTGIVGRRGHLAILHGWTIAGVDIWQLGIALRTQSLEYDICHYTGVCTEKSWVGKTEESKLKVKFSSYYVPALPENVVE